ncbi:MAG: hypothetical protein HXY34_01120 [Candidatus Thorarchaeota archaeon]|nr:hypothetical protein [Candidatus Thorarchaeota archaeon]
MSILGKYRKEADKETESSSATEASQRETARVKTVAKTAPPTKPQGESVPNKERKSPIVSFSIPSDLRQCLQAIRRAKAINLSMWVERQLRLAIEEEFPDVAKQYLES